MKRQSAEKGQSYSSYIKYRVPPADTIRQLVEELCIEKERRNIQQYVN